MRNSMNPRMEENALIQKFIGSAYEHVKNVSESLRFIKDVAGSLEALNALADAAPSIQLFVDNPDFLPWLNDNRELLADLSEAVSAISQDVVKQKHITGTLPYGNTLLSLAHGLDILPEDMISVTGSVNGENGITYPLTNIPGISIWVNATHVFIQMTGSANNFADLPFNVLIAYKE